MTAGVKLEALRDAQKHALVARVEVAAARKRPSSNSIIVLTVIIIFRHASLRRLK